MAHARKQIRTAVDAILSASKVNYNHVFLSRLERARDVMPYLLVHTPSEVSESILVHPTPIYSRDIFLVVQGKVRMTTDNLTYEDTMDEVATEIEEKLTFAALNSELNSKLKALVLQNTDSEIVTDDNERTSATITLSWSVRIHTLEGSAETFI